MNHSGDAAEQIVRISFDGIEHIIRITGAGVKNIAAFIVAAIKSDGTDDKLKLKGKERLANMLKSGKELKIFSMKNSDLEQFSKEAKKYGVVYCALKEKNASPDSIVDVMAKADDASKISRIMERLEFATVDRASVETKIAEQDKDAKTHDSPDRDDTDKLIDMLIDEEGNARPDSSDKIQMSNPTQARTVDEGNQSVSRSKTQSSSKGYTDKIKKPSVKEFLRERTAQNNQKREDKEVNRDQPEPKRTERKTAQHRQPQRGGNKTKKAKER
jgi:hypothetical protein